MRTRSAYIALVCLVTTTPAFAGMPSPLPTPFTRDAFPQSGALSPWVDERLQALSFFLVVFLFCAWVVRKLWGGLRRDWPQLPALSYRGALIGTLLWGLVFLVVLTMISGARELMTPGAWQKSGWTYRLIQDASRDQEPHFRRLRPKQLEALRLEILQYAARHQGGFPDSLSDVKTSRNIPAHPGFEFLYRPGLRADGDSSQILVFEPEVGDAERFVLLVNGLIGSMRTAELEAALETPKSSPLGIQP